MLVYYSTRIFANIGYSANLSQLLAAVMNTGFAIGTFPLPWTIERFGRRRIMIWTAVVCSLCMLIFVACIALPNPTIATNWTAVSFVIVFNFSFGYGWIGCPWLYGPEVSLNLITISVCELVINKSIDRASQISPSGWCSWLCGRVVIFVHYGICRRNCYREYRLEDLDLAACGLYSCHIFCILYVPRSK